MPAAIRLSLPDARRIAVRGEGLARAEELFGFRYRIEIYAPKASREYGYYVLPVLQGDRLVGRIDPLFDRKGGVLRINAVHWEDGPVDVDVDVDEPVASLAAWLGADEVAWP